MATGLAADRQSLVVMTDIGPLQTQVARQPPDLLFRIFLVEPENWHNYTLLSQVMVGTNPLCERVRRPRSLATWNSCAMRYCLGLAGING